MSSIWVSSRSAFSAFSRNVNSLSLCRRSFTEPGHLSTFVLNVYENESKFVQNGRAEALRLPINNNKMSPSSDMSDLVLIQLPRLQVNTFSFSRVTSPYLRGCLIWIICNPYVTSRNSCQKSLKTNLIPSAMLSNTVGLGPENGPLATS